MILTIKLSGLPKQVNGLRYIFISLLGETMMMVMSKTETRW